MGALKGTLFLIVAFFLGFIAHSLQGDITGKVIDLPSPQGHIDVTQIRQYNSGVYVPAQNSTLITFSDTKSMDPLFDSTTVAIEIKPDHIEVGDIVTYRSHTGNRIAHRIIKKYTEKGSTYYILKGDNNPTEDAAIHESAIEGVIVGIIYT